MSKLSVMAAFIEAVIVEGSLQVKLPTIWTDEKQRWESTVGRVKEEKRREEKRREEERRSA
jgi:hypothetical protein